MGSKQQTRFIFKPIIIFFIGLISSSLLTQSNASFPYYGTKIGPLSRLHHGVSGDVYAVDSRTIFIKSFNYDGEAPAAYFYVGHTDKPSNEGAFRLRDERGSMAALTKRYRNKDITLSLPEGKTLRDVKWFSVWCDEFAVSFGDIKISNNLDFPRPQKITALKGVHGVSSDNIVIVDAQTLLVPNFSYDGEAPDAKFWVGRGQRPSPQGLRIPDENGKEDPLRRYDRKTIVLTLPADLTIFDIGHFGVWCEAFTVDFGHVRVPEGLNVPPSLKMLGISPQSKLNCEVLYDDLAFEVRWAVAGESIVVQLVAKLNDNEYMAFGISPNKQRSEMIGADVVVSWVDRETGKGFAQDYYLEDKSQCSGKRGTCPDANIEENTNSVRLLNAAMVNGYSIVTYQRSLRATDRLDLPISVNGTEAIVWAIGPLNERKEASFHTHFTKKPHIIDFGRQPTWNCPMPEGNRAADEDDNDEEAGDIKYSSIAISSTSPIYDDRRDVHNEGYPPARTTSTEPEEEFYDSRPQALQRPNRRQGVRPTENTEIQRGGRPVPTPKPTSTNGAWDIPAIQCFEPEDGVFYAQMGPTGGKHGYSAITGHVGWGISWFINGLLIPEIHVVRGKTYTFVVEGGNNPDIPAKYHPFYITDDPVGGFEHKREEEKKAIRIFAGVHRSRSGQITPIGVGRLCNWTPDVDGPPADDYQSFGAYQRTLTLQCDPGEPGVITWKPDHNTPDTVYYQCFTHRYLGWRIHVHDSCDDARFTTASASERHEIRLPALSQKTQETEDLKYDASIRHETKVSPNDNFLLKHQTDLIKNHNMNGTPPKLTFEITKSTEITKLISDGIRAAEALEESILRNGNNNNNNNVGNTLYSNSNKPGSAPSYTADKPPFIKPLIPEILHGEIMQQPKQQSQFTQTHLLSQHAQQAQLLHNNNINNNNNNNNNNNIQHLIHFHQQQYHNNNNNHLTNHIHHNNPNHNHLNNITHNNNHNKNLPVHPSKQTIGLSEYLRPPQNAPLFHPVKLPGRRPLTGVVKKGAASKPVLPQQLPRRSVPPMIHGPQISAAPSIPQPSIIVSHYRKPIPGLLKPFVKEKPFPIQQIAPVLLLGEPTELNHKRKTDILPHHVYTKPKPLIPVPYKDLVPQDTILQPNIDHEPKIKTHYPVKHLPHPNIVKPVITPTPGVFKKPFSVHETQDDVPPPGIVTMKPAVNLGFKPDSVVVESGFRPIINRDSIAPEVEQTANRREDPGSEIDEVMETDTLFLTAQQGTETQNFEPMFIPSPPDSTNDTIIIRKTPIASLASNKAHLHDSDIPGIDDVFPQVAHLRNATYADLFEGPEEDTEKDAVSVLPFTMSSTNQNKTTENSGAPNMNTTILSENQTIPLKASKPSNANIEFDASNEDEFTDIDDEEFDDDLLEEKDHAQEEEIIAEKLKSSSKPQASYENGPSTKSKLDAVEADLETDSSLSYLEEDDIEFPEEDDREAQAAERIDTYYLPPDNRKILNAQIPSGAVVTFDGKSVVDSSLVLPPKLDSPSIVTSRRQTSKIEELIRTPQFGPFRGEIPPPISEFLSTAEHSTPNFSGEQFTNPSFSTTVSQVRTTANNNGFRQHHTSPSSLPSTTSTSSAPLRPISTKLQLLKHS